MAPWRALSAMEAERWSYRNRLEDSERPPVSYRPHLGETFAFACS